MLNIQKNVTVLLICFMVLGGAPVNCYTDIDLKYLIHDLFVTQGYNKLIEPIPDYTFRKIIYVDMSLYGINSVDELGHKLVTSAQLSILWIDHNLVWDAPSNNGIYHFFYRQTEIWRPAIALVNGFSKLKELGDSFLEVSIAYDGIVYWKPFEVFESKCAVDIHYFPYDTQTCELKFEVWMNYNLQLYLGSTGIDTNFYNPNDEWEVVSTYTRQDDDTTAVFGIHLKRNPGYYMLSIVLPILFLSLLEVFTFVLPSDAGEKMGYSVTVFLAFAVFLTIVSNSLPVSSTPSLLSVYLIYLLANGVAIIIALAFQLRVHHYDDKKPIPVWIKKVVRTIKRFSIRKCCSCCCYRQKRNKIKTVDVQEAIVLNTISCGLNMHAPISTQMSAKTKEVFSLDTTPENVTNESEMDDRETKAGSEIDITWKVVASMIDLVCFVTSLTSVVIATFVVFICIIFHV